MHAVLKGDDCGLKHESFTEQSSRQAPPCGWMDGMHAAEPGAAALLPACLSQFTQCLHLYGHCADD